MAWMWKAYKKDVGDDVVFAPVLNLLLKAPGAAAKLVQRHVPYLDYPSPVLPAAATLPNIATMDRTATETSRPAAVLTGYGFRP